MKIRTIVLAWYLWALTAFAVNGADEAPSREGSGAAVSDAVAAEAGDVFDMPAYRVVGGPLARGPGEYAQPVTRLEDRELQRRLDASLGETLTGLPGVSSTNYFPGASRPIIRGFSNFRVRVLEAGLDPLDASVGSLDHAVAIEPYRVDSVEIIRGPGALLYGGGAVGGAVNVTDSMTPRALGTEPVEGVFTGVADGSNDGVTGAFRTQVNADNVALAFGGLKRRSGDLRIPEFGATDPELREDQPSGRLPNSHVNTDEFFVGASRFFDNGYVGVAVSRFGTDYGLGREVEQEAVGRDAQGRLIVNREFDDFVTIDLDRKRLDLRSEIDTGGDVFERADFRLGIGDYVHHELEDGVIETTFQNRGFDSRLELSHRPLGEIEGGVGVDASRSRFSATGDEAFLRPTRTWKGGVFSFQEWEREPVTLQFGARAEHRHIRPELFERDEITSNTERPDDYRKTGVSGAVGVIWEFVEAHETAVNLSYTERLFNAQELYADGPHVGTFAYELSDHVETGNFDRERSIGLDAALRRKTGRISGDLSGFVQFFPDFVSLRRTDELAFENQDGSFDIRRREEVDDAYLQGRQADGEDNEFLDVTRYQLTEALVVGAEAEVVIALKEALTPADDSLDWILRSDWVRARDLDAGEPLSRIPPIRLGTELLWQHRGFFASADLLRVLRATRTAPHETSTPGHTLVGAGFGYRETFRSVTWDAFFRLENILDEEARNHTSFVKDLAPLPGRHARVGLRMAF